jgi:hypothetical protein
MKCHNGPQTWTDSLEKPLTPRKLDIRFGRNIRSLNRVGLIMTVAKDMSIRKLDLLGIKEVRGDRGGTEPAGEIYFSMERGMRIMN